MNLFSDSCLPVQFSEVMQSQRSPHKVSFFRKLEHILKSDVSTDMMRVLFAALAFLCAEIMFLSAGIGQYFNCDTPACMKTTVSQILEAAPEFSARSLAVPVDVDGLRVGAPHPQALLDDLLDFREVRLQSLVAEHFGKHL